MLLSWTACYGACSSLRRRLTARCVVTCHRGLMYQYHTNSEGTYRVMISSTNALY